jgi:nucleotide-binding universal stress UspA family protein
MYDSILVATDGSGLSRKAVDSAIELAASLAAELFILHVVPRYPTAFFEGGVALEADEVARVERQWAEQGRAVVNEEAARAEQAGVTARAMVVTSDEVADSILAAARKHGCGLVVMASHGRRGLQRVLLGSETQHVLTRADLPVLVLR